MGDEPAVRPASPGPWKVLWRKLLHNRVACIGGAILVVFYLSACFAGFLSPYDPTLGENDFRAFPPILFGSFVMETKTVESEIEQGTKVEIPARRWDWFSGGIHFHDQQGNITFRPHVHPIVEREYKDEYGDQSYVLGIADRSTSLPVRFFVRGKDHEMFSLLGLPGTAIRGPWHLFGVDAPPGTNGVARIYLLGSDQQGRDIYSRMLFGAQISLSVGVFAIMITTVLGMVIGGISGYFGGKTDFVLMRIAEVVLSVPSLYLMIVLGGLLHQVKIDGQPLSSRARYFLIIAILTIVGWAGRARVIRGMVLSLREQDYVVAARALGVATFRTITKHILPNTLSYAIVSASLAVPSYILAEVALSFLNLGIQEPEASWGNMLREAQQPNYLSENPWVAVPGVFIFFTVLAYNFLGDGLRDAADPRAVILSRKQKAEAKARRKAAVKAKSPPASAPPSPPTGAATPAAR